MKLFFASDIHGSMYYCQKMLDALKREKADSLILLGDILYHGPRNDLPRDYSPKKVIEALNNIKDKIICVKGNCDAEVDQMVLDFSISDEIIHIKEGGYDIYLNHGHRKEEFLPSLSGDAILITGHTHIPAKTMQNGVHMLNVGSVSIPKENSHHSYMTFDGKTFVWKTLSGEIYDSLTL